MPGHGDPSALTPLTTAVEAFLLSREAVGCTPKTLDTYCTNLGYFLDYLWDPGVPEPSAITPTHLREYIVSLQRRGLKDTTQHAYLRPVKTWLRWLVEEGDLDASPMERVKMPRLEARIPAPFTQGEVRRLLAACDRKTPIGARDQALILTLLDTGLRASELLTLRVGDIDMRSGLTTVVGKGRKMRQVRVGTRARTAILRMLGKRQDPEPGDALWVAYSRSDQEKGPLTFWGLETLLATLGKRARIHPCAPHRFRRTFALWCLRDGIDLHSLRVLMGHSGLAVLQRYLAIAGEDIARAHAAHSPADKLLGL